MPDAAGELPGKRPPMCHLCKVYMCTVYDIRWEASISNNLLKCQCSSNTIYITETCV